MLRKKIILTAAAALLCAANLWAQPTGSPVATHGQLSVKNGKIVNKDDVPVALRGMSFYWDCDGFGTGTQWYTSAAVKELAENWKVDIVRAAFSDAPNNNGCVGNTNRIKTIVDAAITYGVYVILDFHSHEANSQVSQANAFFDTFLDDNKYVGKPNILYEIFNEPIGPTTWDGDHVTYWKNDVKPYSETMISRIRAKDPNNIILVGTPFYCLKLSVATANPIAASMSHNIAYVFHFYAAEDNHDVQSKAPQLGNAIRAGHAVYVSEFGTTNAQTPFHTISTTLTTDWFEVLDRNDIGWANWSVSSGEMPSAISSGSGDSPSGWQLSTSGSYIKGKLAQYKTNVNVTTAVQGEGTITKVRAGTTVPISGTSVPYGSNVTFSAEPAPGWRFSGWSGDLTGTNTPNTISAIYTAKSVTAIFTEGGLIPDGDFTSVIGSWSSANATRERVAADGGVLQVTVTTGGSTTSASRLLRTNVTGLESGKRYELTFRVKSSASGKNLTARVTNANRNVDFMETAPTIPLTSSWQDFSRQFNMCSNEASVVVMMECGNQGDNWAWQIDDINLREVGAATPAGVCNSSATSAPLFAVRGASWSLSSHSGTLTLRGPAEHGAKVQLFDTRGKMVKSLAAKDGMTLGKSIPAGSYLVVVKNAAGREVLRDRVSMVR